MAFDRRGDEPTTWWCQTNTGQLVAHRATAFDGHQGHIRCFDLGPAPTREGEG